MPIHAQSDIQLPNEVLSIIINELGSDTKNNHSTHAALASCRLASHVLWSLTTPLFFSSMELGGEYLNNGRARNLIQLLSIDDVAASVHTFTLCCGLVEIPSKSEAATLIPKILSHLPHIRHFTLERDKTLQQSWIVSSVHLSVIQPLCKSPNLTTLNLVRICSFPITFILACPNLRFLRLSTVTLHLGDMNPMDAASILQPFYLDSLEIDLHCFRTLDSKGKYYKPFAKCLSQIRHLKFESRDLFEFPSNVPRLGCQLLAAQTLTILDLSIDTFGLPYSIESFPFNLGLFPALRQFKIRLLVLFLSNLDMLSFLTRFLSSSSPKSGIETMEIKFFWDDVYNEDEIENLFSSVPVLWLTLYEVLTNVRSFVSLRKVFFDLALAHRDSCQCPNPEYKKLALSYVKDLVPMARKGQDVEIIYV